jgi:nitric oxide reductase NorQ protein
MEKNNNDDNGASMPEMPEMPEYVPQNGELEGLTKATEAGLNTLLVGPTGCGKTHLVQWFAHIAKREIVTIQGGDGMTPEHVIGYRDVIKEGDASITTWRDGLLTRAMRNGSILYVDEPNALPEGIRFYLFSAMDERREITLAENGGEVVKASPGFIVIGAMNEGAGYSGTSLLNFAFRSRFGAAIDLEYLSRAREIKVIMQRASGVAKEVAEKIADIGEALRKANRRKEIRVPIGTRSLLACAKLIDAGLDARQAGALTLTGQVPASMAAERKAINDTLAAHFAAAVPTPTPTPTPTPAPKATPEQTAFASNLAGAMNTSAPVPVIPIPAPAQPSTADAQPKQLKPNRTK